MSLPETQKAGLVTESNKGKLIIEEKAVPKPGKNQVLVRVEYVPINPSDVINISQAVPYLAKPPRPVGYEGSATVVALGEDLKNPFKVGDRVLIASFGTWAQYLAVDSEKLSLIRDDASLEESACNFINPFTVVGMAHLAKKHGSKAIIHTAGSSALGRMLIRYLKTVGIKSINVVRRDDYTEELLKEGADYVLNSQSADFDKKLKEIAHKEGATIAFEAIGDDWVARLLRTMPDNSIVYTYGLLSLKRDELDKSEFEGTGKETKGYMLPDYLQEVTKSGEIAQVKKDVEDTVSTIFRSKIQKVFKFEDFEEALAYFHENSSKGKVLLKLN